MKHPLRPVLVVVALLLGMSLDHGLPHRYVPDDTAVRCALGIAQDLTGGEVPLTEALFPPDGRYSTYPMLLPDLDLLALGVRFAVGMLFGEWTGPGSFKAAVFEDPGVAWLPARCVSWLLALLVPLGIYRAGRELSRCRAESALAALLAGSSLLLVQYAHTARPWAAMMGFAAVTLASCLRLRRRTHTAAVVTAFICAALAGASFQVGLLFLAFPVVALGLALSRRSGSGPLLVRGLVGLAAATAVLASVGYPHLLLHEGEQTSQVQGGHAGRAETSEGGAVVGVGGQEFAFDQFSGSRAGEVAWSWLGYEPVLVLTGLLGLLALLFRSPSRELLLLVVAPALCFLCLFLLYDGTHVRYLMPVSLFLALGAASLLRRLAGSGRAGAVVAVLLLAVPLVQAARLDQLLGRTDTRTLAAAVLPGLTGQTERIALDGMGSRYGPPLIPLARPLNQTLSWGLWLSRTEARVLEADALGIPPSPDARAVVPIARFWRFDSYFPSDFLYDGLSEAQHRAAGRRIAANRRFIVPVSLADWMDEWSIDAYVQVDRLPDPERRRPVTEFTHANCELVWELSPTGSSPPEEAELPTDMTFALTQLWEYERPGPWIRLWRRTDR
jgi:hypothetical protein